MTLRIGQIAVHNTAPSRTRLIELEDPSGPTSEYASLAEMLLLAGGIGLEPTTQIIGATAANIAEVEATRALRLTLREDQVAANRSWKINRFAAGVAQSATSALALTTAALTNQGIVGMYCINQWSGIAVIKRITLCLATSALTGTRNGSVTLNLFRGMSTLVGTGTEILPKNVGAAAVGPSFVHGLSGRNNCPQAYVVCNVNNVDVLGDTILDSQPIGSLVGGARNVASSTQIQNGVIYDHLTALQPLILTQNHSWVIQLSWPAAVTSQSLSYSCNIVWDEWVPTPMSDR